MWMWGGFSDRGKQNRKHKFFQKKKAGEIWEYIEMNLFGSDIRVEMQCRCNSISVIEMFCTKRRSGEVPSTLMKPHYAEAAQQNRQKMPDLQPTHLPYCLITPVQVATAPKIKAPEGRAARSAFLWAIWVASFPSFFISEEVISNCPYLNLH